jgi:hypothetical protein
MQVIVVELTTIMLVATAPPIVTLVAPLKFAPVIVTLLPPLIGPELGVMTVTVGAGAGGSDGITEFDAAEAVPVPTPFVALTVKV